MKKFLFFFILIIITKSCFSQNTFFSNYYSSSTSTFLNPGVIVRGSDGNYIGMGYELTSLILYKTDESGNMFWWKKITLPTFTVPIKAIALSDSSVAFMLYSNISIYSIMILKADLNGNLLWTKGLYNQFYASFNTLAAAANGGIILSGGGCAGSNMIIQLNANGNIISQCSHTNYPITVWDMVEDGNNEFSYCGIGAGTNQPFCFFKSNSLGTAFDYHEYNVSVDGTGGFGLPAKLIARSFNGGHYCIFPITDSTRTFAFLYLNPQNQLSWSKYISSPDTIFNPSQVIGTPDKGCIVVASNLISLSPLIALQAIMKFDSIGNLEWSKMPGNPADTNWNYLGITSILPDIDNGWITAINKYSTFNICKVDSLFNGFCNYSPFNPVITNFTPQASSHILINSTINFTEDSLNPGVVSLPVYRIDECFSTVSIENFDENSFSLNIFPNPTSTEFQISNFNFQTNDEIMLRDVLGKIYFTRKISSPTSNFKLQTLNFTNGIYFLEVKTKEGVLNKKVVVQH